ncbi:alpha/beta-hydrolase [Coprinellus micaceus]|uniref:triacylglycerol lipase n=1 Tax=Coprinellus micaceus TaxID=71717 RepID=A0A4Y7TGP8_COPMI|nr:alpha/beta-hydrolase [Coprinellus micaceus]
MHDQYRQRRVRFELRHLHAVSEDARVVFHDVNRGDYRAWAAQQHSSLQHQEHLSSSISAPLSPDTSLYAIPTRHLTTYRPPSFAEYDAARVRSARFGQNVRLNWEEEEIIGPDVEKRETLLLLAKMANDAYVEPNDPAWYELPGEWNITYPFGWEPDADGFRGQVFATEDNSTIVVSIKGTSAGLFGGGGPTAKKDKLNDNLLFSCCCARIDWSWTTVCGCYRGGSKCDLDCLEKALVHDSLFYPIGTNLYNNLTYMYPESTVWLIGHSLGGALASLLGATFGNPVVTFESPGERLASTRLHLPQPPSLHHVTHVYHTADPIAMGTCNGVLSSCALGGYALETGCHLGRSIVYDTVTHAGWSVDIRTHGIVGVIEKILKDPWPPSVEEGREVPKFQEEVDCVECYSWEFGDFPDPKAKFRPRLNGTSVGP